MPLMVIDFPYTPEGMQLAKVVQQGVSQAMPDAKIQVIDQEGAPTGDVAGGPPLEASPLGTLAGGPGGPTTLRPSTPNMAGQIGGSPPQMTVGRPPMGGPPPGGMMGGPPPGGMMGGPPPGGPMGGSPRMAGIRRKRLPPNA
jgi:hypothetical protein